jgi:hypothetical protein
MRKERRRIPPLFENRGILRRSFMKIPNKIVYGGMEFKVEFEDHPVIGGESVWGHWDYPNQRIILDSQLAEPAMLATLFHEIAHVIMEMAGFSGLEERMSGWPIYLDMDFSKL